MLIILIYSYHNVYTCQNITLHTVNIIYTCPVKIKIMDLSVNSHSWMSMPAPHPNLLSCLCRILAQKGADCCGDHRWFPWGLGALPEASFEILRHRTARAGRPLVTDANVLPSQFCLLLLLGLVSSLTLRKKMISPSPASLCFVRMLSHD